MVTCVVDCSRSNKDILEFACVSDLVAGRMHAKERVGEPLVSPWRRLQDAAWEFTSVHVSRDFIEGSALAEPCRDERHPISRVIQDLWTCEFHEE